MATFDKTQDAVKELRSYLLAAATRHPDESTEQLKTNVWEAIGHLSAKIEGYEYDLELPRKLTGCRGLPVWEIVKRLQGEALK